MKFIVSLVLAVSSILLTPSFSFSQSPSERIDSLMKTAHERGIFNGNVLVAKKGEIIYQNEIGYADGSKTTNLDPDLRFNIGSISKELNAVALMILAEEGKLELSDPVSKFIDDLPDWSEQVTIKHLLQYTSGLPKVEFDRNKAFSDADAWSFLKTLKNVEFEPGTGYIYSNYNIFLRERIVEEISGQSYGDFLQERIFEPCDMKGAVMDPAPNTSSLSLAFDNKFVNDDFPEFMSGALYLTIRDLYKWTQHLHNFDIISENSLLTLFEGYGSKESSLGVGIVEDDELVMQWNSGSSYNFESSHYINLADKFTVILMTNNKNFNVGDLTNAIDAILRNESFTIPKKSLYMALRTEIFYNGVESGKKLLNHIRSNEKDLYDLNIERAIEKTSGYLFGTDKIEDGIKLLEFAVAEYPNSPDFFLLLGDAYSDKGNNERALNNYKEALKLDPANKQIQARLKKM